MPQSPFVPDENADKEAATSGMRQGLASYGDQGFSLFLRKAFIKGAGLTDAALDRPGIGIADTGNDRDRPKPVLVFSCTPVCVFFGSDRRSPA
jgi:hypothetical protein